MKITGTLFFTAIGLAALGHIISASLVGGACAVGLYREVLDRSWNGRKATREYKEKLRTNFKDLEN